MLTQYIQAAMNRAKYEILEDGTYFGRIPPCRGAWANEKTLEECRVELQSVLEDWILLAVQLRHPLPIIDRINLNQKSAGKLNGSKLKKKVA